MFGFNKLRKRNTSETYDQEKFSNKKTERDRSIEKKYAEDLKKLENVEIGGDPFKYNNQEYRLTKELLAKCDLAPDGQFNLGGREIKMSKSFKVENRDVVIAYVQAGEKGEIFKARSYYRSSSQGLWRYLPDYVERHENRVNPDGTRTEGPAIGGAGWYGKGYDEASLTLPTEMQRALNYQVNERPRAEIGDVIPDFLMCGTACRYESKADYEIAKRSGTLMGDYYREVSDKPKFIYDHNNFSKVAPDNIRIRDDISPDFSHKTNQYHYNSALSGATDAEVFASKGGNLRWTFCSDHAGRSWVGNVEFASPLTSTGLRRDWIDPGDLATPLYEYTKQSSDYGDQSDTKGSYTSMWKNYLSRIPMIREYQNQKTAQSNLA